MPNQKTGSPTLTMTKPSPSLKGNRKDKKLKKMILVGGRMDGHAGVIRNCIQDLGSYEVSAIYDSVLSGESKIDNIPVLDSSENIPAAGKEVSHAFVAIGHNPARHRIGKQLLKLGYTLVTLVHPAAYVAKSAKLGCGVYVGPGACIQNGCEIGDYVIINTGAAIDHNCKIEAGAHIATNASLAGRVRVGTNSFVGVGAKLIPDVRIGNDSMIGAGAVVLKDVSRGVLATGVPAHVKKIWHWEAESDPKEAVSEKPRNIYVSSPSVPAFDEIGDKIQDILDTRMISNFGKYVQLFEAEVQDRLQVKHCRALSNGTTGLALALKVLGIEGEVIVPDFTFSATGHVVVWNNCKPVLADINPETFNLDLASVKKCITKRTKAVIGVHVFGNPCEVEGLQKLCKEHDLKLIYDAAHGFGSTYKGRPVGNFGDIEIFSLSGTKALTTGEGGLAVTNSPELDDLMRLARNYGAGPDYDCKFFGFNGKMPEINAVIGLANMRRLDDLLARRRGISARYEELLREVPGIRFQKIVPGAEVARSYFAIVLDPKKYGHTRDELYTHLETNNIFPRKYFHPPLHKMKAYQSFSHGHLPNATRLSETILCLPIYPHLEDRDVERIAELVITYQRSSKIY